MKSKIVLLVLTTLLTFTTRVTAQNKTLKDTVVSRADIKPSFMGGNKELFDYIDKNLEHPKNAKTSDIKGRVDVSFIVEKDGRLTNIQIERSLSRSHNRKAKKLVRKMPRWKPALLGGQPVRFRFRLPVVFKTEINN
ncbi:energy transducer TonB [Paenimyroides aestuarii]|uniref:Energy transducer TonB n=1 Tax=Paenimyroides aestuarii TaxID=2968490 RepID=A0ABY5NVC7_9FLAO|nr:energy transducer TonB [Paenimyroides aestuarii]UUV22304.1 energy transducer TonB [Paenimyroides aestuarii]